MFLPGPAHAQTLKAFNIGTPVVTVVKTEPVVIVKSGDTLSALAGQYNLSWQGIYCTNRKVIGPDPDVLRVGEQLVMKSSSCNAYSGYGNTAATITTAEYNTAGTPQQIAWHLLASYGGNRPAEYACLNHIIMHESSWNVHAYNPSGAYGIPQALPGSKMSVAGPDWQDSAYTQLKWMIDYYIPGIAKYKTPCGTWAMWQIQGWY